MTKKVPPVITLKKEEVERYFDFIKERHLIYLKKTAGFPRPWTEDSILRDYKFTNIFRELDRGTVWYREHIREPYANHPELFFNTCVYRFFNYFPTAEKIGFIDDYDPNGLETLLRVERAQKNKIFTSAHMLTGTLGGDKITQAVWKIFLPIWNNRQNLEPCPGSTLKEAFERFKTPGMGPFLRYEVITDLRHTRYLSNASDIRTWANCGPGAMRGGDRVCGVYEHKTPNKFRPEQYIQIMQFLLKLSPKYLEDSVPVMEMRDIEHSLCEYDKYARARLGEGRLRAHYVPYVEQV
jgi:hypothetical protein